MYMASLLLPRLFSPSAGRHGLPSEQRSGLLPYLQGNEMKFLNRAYQELGWIQPQKLRKVTLDPRIQLEFF